MESNTLKRFDRLVAILIQLQSKKIVKAHELAERFEVSLRTIYRDIRSLEAAGVPLFGEAGMGYSLVEGYRLPPVMFTRDEAGSFVAAEKLMQGFTDKNLRTHFQSAMFKIKSVLRGPEKNWVESLDSQISIQTAKNSFNAKTPNALQLFFESLAEKKRVILNYQTLKQEKPLSREIEPVGLFHENRYWYILGYCHLRKDYRQFRLDRIYEISLTDNPFFKEHGSVEDYRKKEDLRKKQEVRILVDKKIAPHLKYERDYYGFVSETRKGEKIEMLFRFPENDPGFSRWFLMFADYAQILEPISMKKHLKKILENALKAIENEKTGAENTITS